MQDKQGTGCGAAAVGLNCKKTELTFIRDRVGDESYSGKIIDDIAGKPRIYCSSI